MKKSTVILLLLICLQVCSLAQVPVVIAPPPKLQFFTATGQPLSLGCVFSYVSGTTTALATYTDHTGTVLNANPVPLNAGGFAGGGSSGIWLQAGVAYTLKVVSNGGTNCASGSTQYTIDGIGGGGATLTTVVTFSATPTFVLQAQNQLFEMTLTGNAASNPLTAVGIVAPSIVTFQLTQDGTGGHTFGWPVNVIGGAPIGLGANQVTTQMFVWNGTNATAIGPATTGSGPQLSTGAITANGNVTGNAFISSAANPAGAGVVRMESTGTACWRNNANSGDVCASKDTSDNLIYPNGLGIGGGSILGTTNQSGTGSLCLTVNCALQTPTLNSVRVFGTPSASGYGLTSVVLPAFTLTQSIRQTSQSFTQTGGTVTSVTIAGSTMTVNGTFAGGAANGYQNWAFTLAGFTNAGNNGTFVCSSSTGSTLVFINAADVNEGSPPATATVTSDANTTDYLGTITSGAANYYVGFPPFTVTGFTNSGNNGTTFSAIASTATVMSVTNTSGVNETHSGALTSTDAVLATWKVTPSFNAPHKVTSTGDITMTTNGTVYTLLTESVTMPTAPGLYRVIVSYSQWFITGGNVCSAEVIDTTNSYGWAFSQHNDNGLGYSALVGSEVSTQTYAAGATATFTLKGVCAGSSITAAQNSASSAVLSPNLPSYLSVTPVSTN